MKLENNIFRNLDILFSLRIYTRKSPDEKPVVENSTHLVFGAGRVKILSFYNTYINLPDNQKYLKYLEEGNINRKYLHSLVCKKQIVQDDRSIRNKKYGSEIFLRNNLKFYTNGKEKNKNLKASE